MGRKYIKQRTSSNFVYPNNSLEEYDVDIVHDINNNSVSGTTTSITASSISSSSITFSFDYTWAQNSAEPFLFTGTSYNFLSVHLIEPNTIYYKPWRLVNAVTDDAASTKSGTVTFTVTPSQMGVSSFSNGVYSFEIRMIGKRAIFPICQSVTISTVPVPTPTPTGTPVSTPTPTPTITPTIGGIYTTGATINVTDTGYIKYTSTTGDTYFYCSTIGSQVLTDCLICSSIREGIPFQDLAVFTIINCGSSCPGPVPSPTPTPSVTPCFGYNNCEYYDFTISATDVAASYNGTVYADYFTCAGEGAVTATYTFPGAGSYTDTVCVYSFAIPTPEPEIYYYSSSPEITKIPASNSSSEIGGFCCG